MPHTRDPLRRFKTGLALPGLSYLAVGIQEVLLGVVKVLLLRQVFLMQDLEVSTWNLLPNSNLDPRIFARPQMSNKLASAGRAALRVPIRLVARQLLNISRVIIPHKRPEPTLIRRPPRIIKPKLCAVRMLAVLARAIPPVIQNLVRLWVVLQNDEAGVEVGLVELVLVLGLVRVEGEGEGVCGRVDVPVVHQPLHGEVEVVEDCVGVEVDAGVVVLEDLGDDGGFHPGGTTVFGGLDADEVVLVAVNFCYNIKT